MNKAEMMILVIDHDFGEDPWMLWDICTHTSLLKREDQFARYLIPPFCFWQRGRSEFQECLSSLILYILCASHEVQCFAGKRIFLTHTRRLTFQKVEICGAPLQEIFSKNLELHLWRRAFHKQRQKMCGTHFKSNIHAIKLAAKNCSKKKTEKVWWTSWIIRIYWSNYHEISANCVYLQRL